MSVSVLGKGINVFNRTYLLLAVKAQRLELAKF